MNWAQFKDPVSHMCLAGAVVAQEVAGLSPFTVMTNIFATEFSENMHYYITSWDRQRLLTCLF